MNNELIAGVGWIYFICETPDCKYRNQKGNHFKRMSEILIVLFIIIVMYNNKGKLN